MRLAGQTAGKASQWRMEVRPPDRPGDGIRLTEAHGGSNFHEFSAFTLDKFWKWAQHRVSCIDKVAKSMRGCFANRHFEQIDRLLSPHLLDRVVRVGAGQVG